MRSLAGLRESPKFTIVTMLGIVRDALRASGAELVASGILDSPDDIFFLHVSELRALDAGDGRDWRALVHERRGTYVREQRRRRVPRVLLSDGRAFYGDAASAEGTGKETLTGTPVSPGVAVGPVRVVLDPRAVQLTPGEILVCRGTDPAWTPLFLSAAGLVTEVGGLMTHGAVVAREYGIPAVVGVHDATVRLRTGERVRVDGTRGSITVFADTSATQGEPH
jgi:rifampicin phosphotransferase